MERSISMAQKRRAHQVPLSAEDNTTDEPSSKRARIAERSPQDSSAVQTDYFNGSTILWQESDIDFETRMDATREGAKWLETKVKEKRWERLGFGPILLPEARLTDHRNEIHSELESHPTTDDSAMIDDEVSATKPCESPRYIGGGDYIVNGVIVWAESDVDFAARMEKQSQEATREGIKWLKAKAEDHKKRWERWEALGYHLPTESPETRFINYRNKIYSELRSRIPERLKHPAAMIKDAVSATKPCESPRYEANGDTIVNGVIAWAESDVDFAAKMEKRSQEVTRAEGNKWLEAKVEDQKKRWERSEALGYGPTESPETTKKEVNWSEVIARERKKQLEALKALGYCGSTESSETAWTNYRNKDKGYPEV